jgi:predicted 3-demethylubiquinone-9 3-methyltransferase (glyoxalase superfamily)
MSKAKTKRKSRGKSTPTSKTRAKTKTKTKTKTNAKTKSKLAAQKIVPHLWYVREAEEAARFYASVFPNSRVDRVTTLPAESPSGPAGSVAIVELTLCGQAFVAFSAGPHHDFNDAISFMVNCESQAELDRYWNALLNNGGKPQACGWIIDKYGVRWQIAPTVLGEMMASKDKTKAKRAAEEMLRQVKLDIAKLEAAFNGR